MTKSFLVNPHLEGGPFFWEGGSTGVMLSHGFTATSAEVRPLAKTLHQKGYTVAGPLLPGHGTDPAELNRCRWQDWYQAVEETYLRLAERCERVVVGGESMGALLAVLLAARHPQTAAVLAYAPALQLRSRINTILAPLAARLAESRPKPVNPPTPADAIWQGYRVNPLAATVQLLHLQKEVRRALPKVNQPLLVIQGRLDRALSLQAAEILYREAGSQVKALHWFDRSAHCLLLDGEMEQAETITLAFLENLDTPGGKNIS